MSLKDIVKSQIKRRKENPKKLIGDAIAFIAGILSYQFAIKPVVNYFMDTNKFSRAQEFYFV